MIAMTSRTILVLEQLAGAATTEHHQSMACGFATALVCVNLAMMILITSGTSPTDKISLLPQVGKYSMKTAPSGTNLLQLSPLFSPLLTVPMTPMAHSLSPSHQLQ